MGGGYSSLLEGFNNKTVWKSLSLAFYASVLKVFMNVKLALSTCSCNSFSHTVLSSRQIKIIVNIHEHN